MTGLSIHTSMYGDAGTIAVRAKTLSRDAMSFRDRDYLPLPDPYFT